MLVQSTVGSKQETVGSYVVQIARQLPTLSNVKI
jgi:hypothetical protein